MNKCYACGEPIRRGYPMITNKGESVIICERCKRLWKKSKAEGQYATLEEAAEARKRGEELYGYVGETR